MKLYWHARDLTDVPVVAVVNGAWTAETALFDLEDVEVPGGEPLIFGRGRVVGNKWKPGDERRLPYLDPDQEQEAPARWDLPRAEVFLHFRDTADRDRVVRVCCSMREHVD